MSILTSIQKPIIILNSESKRFCVLRRGGSNKKWESESLNVFNPNEALMGEKKIKSLEMLLQSVTAPFQRSMCHPHSKWPKYRFPVWSLTPIISLPPQTCQIYF